MASNRISDLPEDVMVEILVKLPVKSLIRFTCVCKSWYKLIKSNTFIHKHLDHNTDELPLLFHLESRGDHAFLSNDLTGFVDRDFHNIYLQKFSLIVGHCNGIFCFYDPVSLKGATLWNPANRETRILPEFPIDDDKQQHYLELGWDRTTNDYKVVVFSSRRVIGAGVENTFMIYSMNSDSWKHVQGNVPNYDQLTCGLGVKYLVGIIYWLGKVGETLRLHLFRLSNEVFEEITIPDFLQVSKGTLEIYNDHIAIICRQEKENYAICFDVWVLDDSCWSKAFNIQTSENLIHPLGIWKDGQVFFMVRDEIIYIYDPRSQLLDGRGVSTFFLKVRAYKESLVSVKRMSRE